MIDKENFVLELPELRIRERAALIVPKCAHCGGDALIMSDSEAAEIVKYDQEIETFSPEMNRAIKNIAYLCAACLNRADGVRREEIRARQIRQLRHRCYSTGLLPRVAEGCTFADSSHNLEERNPDLWNLCRLPLTQNLWIHGMPGTGKTYLARCVLNAALDDGHRAAEISALTVNEIASRFKWQDELKRYADVSILLIDDMDKPRWTPAGLDAMFYLMDRRNARKTARLIVTANQRSKDAVQPWYSVRPDNRSIPMAICERMLPIKNVEMVGQSIRREPIQQNLTENDTQNAGKHGCTAQGGDNAAPVGVDCPQDGENGVTSLKTNEGE